MKLLFCKHCHDVFSITLRDVKSCSCGDTWGRYTDRRNATWGGAGIPLGIPNSDLNTAEARFAEGRPASLRLWVEHASPSFLHERAVSPEKASA